MTGAPSFAIIIPFFDEAQNVELVCIELKEVLRKELSEGEVVDAFIPIRTLYSFMPAMAVAAGFQVVEKPVNHRPRQHGSSKYTTTSFLFLPVVDFLGLKWFTFRRCNGGSAHSLHQGTIQRRSRDVFYIHPFKRWAATVTVAIAI